MELPCLRISYGCELVPEEHLFRLFEPYGITRKAFRYFLENQLCLSPLVFNNGLRLYDRHQFAVAIKACTMIGEPGFAVDAEATDGMRKSLVPRLIREGRQALLESLYHGLYASFKGKEGEEAAMVRSAVDRLERTMRKVIMKQKEYSDMQSRKAMQRWHRRKLDGRDLNAPKPPEASDDE